MKTLLRSREGSREAGSHVGSCGMAPWRVHGHVGAGFRCSPPSEAVRDHVTRSLGGSPRTWGGWALHPLTPRRVH